MELKAFQDRFSEFLYARRPDQSRAHWIIGQCENQNDKIDLGLRIYRNNLLVALTAVLNDIFPCTQKLLTDDVFVELTKDFVYSYPSCHHDLNSYGENFPKFLTDHLKHPQKEFFSELAHLEWLWEKCIVLKDDKMMSIQEAIERVQVNGDNSQFSLRQSALIFTDHHGAFTYWKESPKTEEGLLPLTNTSHETKYFLIWKDNFVRNIFEIEAPLQSFIQNLQKSLTVGEICQSGSFKERPELFMQCLNTSLIRGWIKN